jgi:hypothetical protein
MRNESPNCIRFSEPNDTTPWDQCLELSISKVKKWRRCQKAYEYKYIQKLTPKKKAVALTRGTWMHSCLEARDQGRNWIETIKELKAKEYDPLFEEEKAELGPLPTEVFRIMRGYVQTYDKVDKEYEVISCEQQFMIKLPGYPLILTGVIDKIARKKSTGGIWLFEHKTVGRDLPSEDYKITDIQTSIYVFAAMCIAESLGFKSEDVEGIIFDYIKTKPPTIPEVLKSGEMSRRRIDCDKWTYLECLKKAGLDPKDYTDFLDKLEENKFFVRVPMSRSDDMVIQLVNELVYSGIQIIALTGKPTAVLTRSLDWTCDRPRCEYRDLCIADVQRLDTDFLKQTQFTTGDEEDGGNEKDESQSDY